MINATEAIQGFLNHLGTDLKATHKFGSEQNSASDMELTQRQLDAFCKANDLPPLSKDWETKVVFPAIVD